MHTIEFDLISGFIHRKMTRKILNIFYKTCISNIPKGEFHLKEDKSLLASTFIFKADYLSYDQYIWVNQMYDDLMRSAQASFI